jgi:hypothetical protein
MNHWLYPGVLPETGRTKGTLNEAVNAFSVERLMEAVGRSGADWLIFTLGQNTGNYVSPNEEIERLCGVGHCSRRDLALEIASGLRRMGKKFIAYLPCEVAANTTLHEGMRWNSEHGSDQHEFQQSYTRVVRVWAERFGKLLDGWWFDGCYTWPVFHNRFMEWDLWYSAARAGNPDAVVTFNDGSFCIGNTQPVRPEHDYLSGETEMLIGGRVRLGRGVTPDTHLPEGRFVEGTKCQWHSLLPVDCMWMHGAPAPEWLPGNPFHSMPPGTQAGPMEAPVYGDDELGSFLRTCLAAGGAVTMNVGIYEEGHMGAETLAQLERLRPTLTGKHR